MACQLFQSKTNEKANFVQFYSKPIDGSSEKVNKIKILKKNMERRSIDAIFCNYNIAKTFSYCKKLQVLGTCLKCYKRSVLNWFAFSEVQSI